MSERAGAIAYQPALDGVRAVAVAMVLIFHLDLGFLTGGYLGVSVFFTLSGFLITSLLLNERERTGGISFSGFYTRRVRRLLPASMVCIAAVAVMAAAGWYDRSGDVRPSVFGSLFQVENWVALGRDQSYADLFAAPSPLDHFWSLAIEEQFYWVWPLAVAGIVALVVRRHGRRTGGGDTAPLGSTTTRRGVLLVLVALFIVTSASAFVTAHTLGADAAYFASWARFAEILAGAVLAAAMAGRTLPRWWAGVGAVCLVAVIALCQVLPAGRGLAYEGWLPVFALLSTGLIAGLQIDGPLRSILGVRPLVALGRISFGVYLYHWPVFVLLDRTRTDLDRWPLAALRLAVTAAVALVSYRFLEQPIRERRRLVGTPRFVVGLVGTIVAVAVFTTVAVTKPTSTDAFDTVDPGETLAPIESLAPLAPLVPLVPATDASPSDTATLPASIAPVATSASASDSTDQPGAEPTGPGETGSSTGVATIAPSTAAPSTVELVPARPVRMLVVGDSTARAVGAGLVAWSQERPDLAQVEVSGYPGCGLLDSDQRWFGGQWEDVPTACGTVFDEDVIQRISEIRPDVVVVITSFWDVTDHRWDEDGGVTETPFDARFRDRLLTRLTNYSDELLFAGAPKVVWVEHPAVDYLWDDVDEPADDPARYTVLADVIRQAATEHADAVRVVDLAGWVTEQGLDGDRDARPDGVHFTEQSSTDIARTWLGPQLIAATLS